MNFRKLLIFFGVLAVLVFAFSNLTHIFDGDFGWYLRFGRDAVTGSFPYTDTYTWGYAGTAWINHEWLGNILTWLAYDHLGYIPLEMIVAVCITVLFVTAPLVFLKKLSPGTVLASLICLVSVDYITSLRPTTIAPLFTLWLLYTLENISNRKLLYTWPLLFLVWSWLHGSWILGFILIGLYGFGVGVAQFSPRLGKAVSWTRREYVAVGVMSVVSFLVTAINPYGFRLWGEIVSYFTENYFKHYITEWLPNYTYPIYWSFFILLGLSLVLLFRFWQAKQITFPQVLLYFFFAATAVLYRRNTLYFALIISPLLAAAIDTIFAALKEKVVTVSVSVLLVVLIIFWGRTAFWIADPWHQTAFLTARGFPAEAAHYLQIQGDKQIVFNEFRWGGFMNWTLPDTLVYLDGRGTATWRYSPEETAFQHYRTIRFDAGGLQEIEATPANYIMLQREFTGYYQPDWLNRLTFGDETLSAITAPTSTQLEIDLVASRKWQKVYEDSLALIFKRQ